MARDEGEFGGNAVIVGAVWKFGSNTGATVVFVEVAAVFDELEVLREPPVVVSAGAVFLRGARALFQAVTGLHFAERALRVPRVGMGLTRVEREAIRRPTDEKHLFSIATEPRNEAGGQRMVMIGTGGLDVGVVLIEAEIEEAGRSFIAPAGARVVVPCLAGARLERDAVQRDSPPPAAAKRRSDCDVWLERNAKRVALRCGGVRVAASRKCTGRVVGPAVGFDEAVIAFDGDAHLVLHRSVRRRCSAGSAPSRRPSLREEKRGRCSERCVFDVTGMSNRYRAHGSKCDQCDEVFPTKG